jgi:hypothetical protein
MIFNKNNMQSEKSTPAITTKPASQGAGKHGKSEEQPRHHHQSIQRRSVATDEEKKEKEAKAAIHRKKGPHTGHSPA